MTPIRQGDLALIPTTRAVTGEVGSHTLAIGEESGHAHVIDGAVFDPTAVLSPCGLYRHHLSRTWAPGTSMLFVMLNPSTADAYQDDPTIRRCIGFAKREGFAGVEVVNLSPFRATDPRAMLAHEVPADVLGTDASIIRPRLHAAGKVVVAWGSHGSRVPHLVERMLGILAVEDQDELWCLGTTKAGQPKHPLYLRADTPLVRWEVPDAE